MNTQDAAPTMPLEQWLPSHFISATCRGERCGPCDREGRATDAAHKVGEEIPFDDPHQMRHNLTQYVCCAHYAALMGRLAAAGCGLAPQEQGPREPEPAVRALMHDPFPDEWGALTANLLRNWSDEARARLRDFLSLRLAAPLTSPEGRERAVLRKLAAALAGYVEGDERRHSAQGWTGTARLLAGREALRVANEFMCSTPEYPDCVDEGCDGSCGFSAHARRALTPPTESREEARDEG